MEDWTNMIPIPHGMGYKKKVYFVSKLYVSWRNGVGVRIVMHMYSW